MQILNHSETEFSFTRSQEHLRRYRTIDSSTSIST
jgi:hypothetical protein